MPPNEISTTVFFIFISSEKMVRIFDRTIQNNYFGFGIFAKKY
ncbi:hypothetical protein MRBBS_0843 [Marinobacter sp. BSs20148]|nr:hypothetical protein MRBBS_0843 [Marinobacter sp. BSs20148]